MLTVEYRVNGQLIGFTNIHNVCEVRDITTNLHNRAGCHLCSYTVNHRADNLGKLISTTVEHNREDRFEVLIYKAIEKVLKEIDSPQNCKRV